MNPWAQVSLTYPSSTTITTFPSPQNLSPPSVTPKQREKKTMTERAPRAESRKSSFFLLLN